MIDQCHSTSPIKIQRPFKIPREQNAGARGLHFQGFFLTTSGNLSAFAGYPGGTHAWRGGGGGGGGGGVFPVGIRRYISDGEVRIRNTFLGPIKSN